MIIVSTVLRKILELLRFLRHHNLCHGNTLVARILSDENNDRTIRLAFLLDCSIKLLGDLASHRDPHQMAVDVVQFLNSADRIVRAHVSGTMSFVTFNTTRIVRLPSTHLVDDHQTSHSPVALSNDELFSASTDQIQKHFIGDHFGREGFGVSALK